MFESLEDNQLQVTNKKKNTLSYYPNTISIEPLEKLFNATEWLYQEARRDFDSTQQEMEDNRKEKGCSGENLDLADNMSIRLGSRTLAYVHQICLMEDILKKEFETLSESLEKATKGKVQISKDEQVENLTERVKHIRTYRDKVAAHTAYTDPKPEDTSTTQVRSILNLFPRRGVLNVGSNFLNGFNTEEHSIPNLSIFEWKRDVVPFIVGWKKLFLKTLKEVHDECPFENAEYKVEIHYPHKVDG